MADYTENLRSLREDSDLTQAQVAAAPGDHAAGVCPV